MMFEVAAPSRYLSRQDKYFGDERGIGALGWSATLPHFACRRHASTACALVRRPLLFSPGLDREGILHIGDFATQPHAPERLYEEITADCRNMVYAAVREQIEARRKPLFASGGSSTELWPTA
jgi:hypothetical protein